MQAMDLQEDGSAQELTIGGYHIGGARPFQLFFCAGRALRVMVHTSDCWHMGSFLLTFALQERSEQERLAK
jgi:hypothetical protein